MDEEICDGVRILCERMENNPEDFIEGPIDPNTFSRSQGKFYYDGRNIEALARGNPESIDLYWHLNQTERDALVASYKTMMRGEFTRRVVEKLLDAPEPEVRYTAQGLRAGKSVLTTQQMQNESLRLLNKTFEDVYKYKASGRYATGFTAQEIGPVDELKKWATE